MSTEESATPNETQKLKTKLTVKKKDSASYTADFSVTDVKEFEKNNEKQSLKRKKISASEPEETVKPLKRKQPSESKTDTQKPLKKKSVSVDNDSNDVAKPVRKKRPVSENDDTVKPVRKKRPVSENDDAVKPVRKKRPVSENDDTVKPVRKKRPSTESNVKKHSSQTVKNKEEAEPVQPKKTKLKLKKNAKILLAALGAVAVFCCVLIVNSSHKNVEEINAKHMASAEAYSEMESLAMETTEETTETETETETETLPPATLNQSFENKEYPLFIDPNYSVDPTKPMIALTFDDGPAEGSTDDILDVLEQYHAHATFFVVGDNITPSTERLIKREYELGCEIGNHTKEHLSLRRELDLEGGLEALKAVDEKVNNCIGRETAHIRPPYGEYTEAILEACGRNFIYWSLDSNDWQWMDAEKDYDVVMENVSDGDIILMHDIHQPSADAVKRLVPDLIAQGYQFVTVSELMYYRNFTLDKGVVLYNLHPDAPFYDSLYEEEVTNYNPNGAAAQQYEPEEENNGDSDNADVNNEENADVVSDADPELPAEQNVVPAYDNTAAEGGFVPDENVYPDVTVQENPQN